MHVWHLIKTPIFYYTATMCGCIYRGTRIYMEISNSINATCIYLFFVLVDGSTWGVAAAVVGVCGWCLACGPHLRDYETDSCTDRLLC
jgi:hypothetical protein